MKMCSMSFVWFQIWIALVGKHRLDMDMMAFPPGRSTLLISRNTCRVAAERSGAACSSTPPQEIQEWLGGHTSVVILSVSRLAGRGDHTIEGFFGGATSAREACLDKLPRGVKRGKHPETQKTSKKN